MLVASNTSPISNLAIIGRLDLLQAQFGQVRIPGAVKEELGQLSHADALRERARLHVSPSLEAHGLETTGE